MFYYIIHNSKLLMNISLLLILLFVSHIKLLIRVT